MSGTEHFDQAARTWDLEDRRVAMAHGVAQAIREAIRPTLDLEALDFGCGTGLVTLEVAPWVGAITGADTSRGMLDTLKAKAEAQGRRVRLLALDGLEDLDGTYHLILSSMALHHVEDVPACFRRFHGLLHPGGRVALADLDAEDGSFHDAPSGVFHQGFRREQIQAWLEGAGFQDVTLRTATVTNKGDRAYPIFLATGRKP